MIWFTKHIDTFWFTKAPASRLALLRIILGLYTLYYVGKRFSMFMRVAKNDPVLFKPVGVASHLQEPIAPSVFRKLLVTLLIANVAFIFGWRHRYTGPLFATLLLWILCYRNSWSMIYHSDNTIVLHAIILGLAPAADALSLDSCKQILTSSSENGDTASKSGTQYGWPIQLINTVTVVTYFLSGVAKVKGPLGWKWGSGESLRSQIAVDGLRKDVLGEGASKLAFTLYNQTALFKILAIGSLIMELLAPVVLLDKRVSRLWAAGAFLLHWGIYFVMKITFRYQLTGLLYTSFFDIERVAALFGNKDGIKIA